MIGPIRHPKRKGFSVSPAILGPTIGRIFSDEDVLDDYWPSDGLLLLGLYRNRLSVPRHFKPFDIRAHGNCITRVDSMLSCQNQCDGMLASMFHGACANRLKFSIDVQEYVCLVVRRSLYAASKELSAVNDVVHAVQIRDTAINHPNISPPINLGRSNQT